MQGLVLVGFIVEEISNVDVKRVSQWSMKYRSRSSDQGTCKVSTSRSTAQGLLALGLLVKEIPSVDVTCQSHCIAK